MTHISILNQLRNKISGRVRVLGPPFIYDVLEDMHSYTKVSHSEGPRVVQKFQ